MLIKSLQHQPFWRLLIVLFLGFTSGLPLALTGTALQAWLTVENIDVATIGFFSLVGMPYTFKFLWAPLMDRFEPPFFGRRRGWLVLTQLGLAAILFFMSHINPSQNTQFFALIAVVIAFLSASQDVVIDAYRADILDASERGLGSSLGVFGYRMAMILSGGIAFVWADPKANAWSWNKIYSIMAILLLISAVFSLLFVPKVSKQFVAPKSNAKNDLIGFSAVVIAVVIGYFFTTKLASPIMNNLLAPIFPLQPDGLINPAKTKWVDLTALFLGIIFTIPLARFAALKAKYETLNVSLQSYFNIQGAVAILLLIILYKLGDSFAGSLTTNFLIKGAGFAQAEIGVVNKVIGIWLTIFGAILGGAIMLKLGLYRSLAIFGVLQMLSNLGFWLVAELGKNAWGAFPLEAFDLLIVTLKESTQVDWLLLFAVGSENITGGMGTAAFVAFLMALCNQKFSATQYALLSAFAAVGRVWVGPMAGTLIDSFGWSNFFIFSTFMALPGLYMLFHLRHTIKALETPRGHSLIDD